MNKVVVYDSYTVCSFVRFSRSQFRFLTFMGSVSLNEWLCVCVCDCTDIREGWEHNELQSHPNVTTICTTSCTYMNDNQKRFDV